MSKMFSTNPITGIEYYHGSYPWMDDDGKAYYITCDSFGSECPENWNEIADFLNQLIDERGIAQDRETVDELWEAYWRGEIKMP